MISVNPMNKTLKILIISPDVLPVPATQGGAVEKLIEQLVAFKNNDCIIHATSIMPNESYYPQNNIFYIPIKPFEKFISRVLGWISRKFGISRAYTNIYLYKIKKLIDLNKYDYVIFENQPEYVLPFNREKYSCKLIIHLHNDKLNSKSKYKESILSNITLILTVSNYIKDQVLTIRGLNSSDVVVFFNCIDIQKFSSIPKEPTYFKNNLKKFYMEDAFNILFHGRLDPTKGVLELLKALNLINDIKINLIIVGSSWFGNTKKSPFMNKLLIESKIFNHSMNFTGFVKNKYIPVLLKKSDLIVLPSIWNDPCPIAVFEAAASRANLVTTDSGGIPEIIYNHKNIVQRLPKNTFIERLSEMIKTNLLIKNSQAIEENFNHVKNFDAHDYPDRLIKILKN